MIVSICGKVKTTQDLTRLLTAIVVEICPRGCDKVHSDRFGTRALLMRNLFPKMTGNLVLRDERKLDILYPSKFGGARVMVDILYLAKS
jgi:hypothetical protein